LRGNSQLTVERVLRDADIRVPLEAWIKRRHMREPDTKIIHELPIPRPSARVDMAVINGRLAGFEIKSDVDSAARLVNQVASFSQVFERMTLVTTRKHAGNLPKHVPDWWEILVCDGSEFRVQRRGRANADVDVRRLLHVLTRAELLHVEEICTINSRSKNRVKEVIIEDILSESSPRSTRSAVRTVLKLR
jgi:hypothetical protein